MSSATIEISITCKVNGESSLDEIRADIMKTLEARRKGQVVMTVYYVDLGDSDE